MLLEFKALGAPAQQARLHNGHLYGGFHPSQLALNFLHFGFLFFIGMPPFYVFNVDFHLKMLGVVPAGANILLLFFTDAFRNCDDLGPGEEAPSFAKFFAVTSIVLAVLLIVLGRYMPFFEDTLTPGN